MSRQSYNGHDQASVMWFVGGGWRCLCGAWKCRYTFERSSQFYNEGGESGGDVRR